jgi:hypothetical protein
MTLVDRHRSHTKLHSKVHKWLDGPGLALGHPIQFHRIISIPLNANGYQVVWRTPMSQAGQASVYLGQKMSIDKQGGESEDAWHKIFEGMPDLT